MKTKELLKNIQGVFKPPVKKYYFGKLRHGTPYFYPMHFNSNIISIRRLKLNTDVTTKLDFSALSEKFFRNRKEMTVGEIADYKSEIDNEFSRLESIDFSLFFKDAISKFQKIAKFYE